jgi:hypothetical protein
VYGVKEEFFGKTKRLEIEVNNVKGRAAGTKGWNLPHKHRNHFWRCSTCSSNLAKWNERLERATAQKSLGFFGVVPLVPVFFAVSGLIWTEHSPRMLNPHFIRSAGSGQPH